MIESEKIEELIQDKIVLAKDCEPHEAVIRLKSIREIIEKLKTDATQNKREIWE